MPRWPEILQKGSHTSADDPARILARCGTACLEWVVLKRAPLGQSCRVIIAAVLSLSAAEALKLHLPLWSVLAALFVTQISRGKSMRGTLDYIAGTVGGAGFAVLVAVAVPHGSGLSLVGVLAISVAPLAILAAFFPGLAIAPATAAIVILLPTMTHASSGASAVDRIMEVALGAAIGLAVVFLSRRPHLPRIVTRLRNIGGEKTNLSIDNAWVAKIESNAASNIDR